MLACPRFRPSLRVSVVPPDLLVLADATGFSGLRGPLFPRIAALLDGRRSLPAIAEELSSTAPFPDVHYALTLLEEGGYLDSGEPGVPSIERIARPAQHTLGDLLRVSDLERAVVRDLSVVTTDDYLHPDLADINASSLATGSPWILVQPFGRRPLLGPLLRPGETACWECLARRLRMNQPLAEFLRLHGGTSLEAAGAAREESHESTPGGPSRVLPVLRRWAEGGGLARLEGQLFAFEEASAVPQPHSVQRLPDCLACGTAERSKGVPRDGLSLRARPKRGPADGGYRVVPPETTVARHAHHMSPLTGIVDELRPVHRDEFTQVYTAGFPFPPRLRDRSFFDLGLRARATGKGMHAAQAKASALCEALERFSGLYRGDEPRRRASYLDLQADAIHPSACLQFSPAQYADRDRWNELERDANWIPEPFREDQPIDWSPLWSLTEERWRHLPTGYCYYGAPMPSEHDFCRPDSNGNAAGNNLEEAILQGFLEVVERDGVALWWYNRVARPAVELQSFDEPYFEKLVAHYRTLGREVWVLDLTTDLRIPTFVAVSLLMGSPGCEDLLVGFGAHFDPTLGVARALTEMNQFLPSALRGRPQRISHLPVDGSHWLRPNADARPLRREDYPFAPTEDLREDLFRCIALARGGGLDLLVLDQTRGEVGLSVVKVVVPGLRPFWARFAPGRLYEVPVQLGWCASATAEKDLNSSPLIV